MSLGRPCGAWPRDAWLVRSLSDALNGHDRDVTKSGPKRGYFADAGGLWAERRHERFLARPDGVHPPVDPLAWLDKLTRENGDYRGGGRAKRWTSGREEQDWNNDVGEDSGERPGEVKWKDLGDPEAAELLGPAARSGLT